MVVVVPLPPHWLHIAYWGYRYRYLLKYKHTTDKDTAGLCTQCSHGWQADKNFFLSRGLATVKNEMFFWDFYNIVF